MKRFKGNEKTGVCFVENRKKFYLCSGIYKGIPHLNMKKLIVAVAFLCSASITASAQQVYGEIMKMSKKVADDKSRSLQSRKIATFQVDALNYAAMKARELMPDSTARMLDVQALAMYEYVDLFTRQLTKETRRKDREALIELFRQVSLENPRYQDMDKDLVLSYCLKEGYLTQFSLDTDWVKALASVKRIMSNM